MTLKTARATASTRDLDDQRRYFYSPLRLHGSIAAVFSARSFGSSSVMCGSSEKVPAPFGVLELPG